MNNSRIRNLKTEILSDNWYLLRKCIFEYQKKDGTWEIQEREVYDRGNGATILLYNKLKKTVVLTRQFRVPTYVNGNKTGMLIESCAGLLDKDNAEDCIKKETEEETGYTIASVEKIFEAYMSPGSVTEIVHFFIAEYESSMKTGKGGGAENEQEEIEVLELNIYKAIAMIGTGEIKDGKTIILLQHLALLGIFDNRVL
jgi:GDP-mannose pyrophosphatase NudK|tara:strand:- start:947 stop:1543 length:597 start_codon:yes stop_codon:yes gene_type:complete